VSTLPGEPGVAVLVDECVVVEVGVGGVDARDFFGLAGAEGFVGVETPNAFEEALAAENLVEAGDAAGKMIGGIEEGGVGIGDFDAFAEKGWRNGGVRANRRVTFIEEFDGFASPDGPMAEKAADDAAFDLLAIDGKNVRSEQVHYDVVVVAGVERNVAARFGDGADDVKTLVAIEGSDFDGGDIFDFGELAPEFVGESATADRGLQVEADDGKNLCDGAAMGEERCVGGVRKRGEAEQAGVVAKIGEERGFANSLGRITTDSADANERNGTVAIVTIHFFSGECQDGFEEADLRIANGELRGVNADGEATGAGGDVVASECALAAFVEMAVCVEGEGMSGDDGALPEKLQNFGINWRGHALG